MPWFTVFYSFSSNFAARRATKQLVGRVRISGVVLAYWFTVGTLMAAEYHGTIKSGGLPIPGAVVTASQGDKKLTTTTDEQGAYSFPDLSDGTWTIAVEMFGFDKTSSQVSIAAGTAAAEWDLRLQPFNHPETAAAPPKQTSPAAAPGKSGAPAANATAAGGASSGRGGQQTANGGRGAFQRLDVNASADAGAVPGETAARTTM